MNSQVSCIPRGVVAFDYGAKTYRFGYALDDAEANRLVQAIKERFDIPHEPRPD